MSAIIAKEILGPVFNFAKLAKAQRLHFGTCSDPSAKIDCNVVGLKVPLQRCVAETDSENALVALDD